VHFARSLVEAEQEGVPLHEGEENLIHISHAEVSAKLVPLIYCRTGEARSRSAVDPGELVH
jgi:hypothetical protein